MLRTLKPLILWLDAMITRLWNEAVRRKDMFIHGEFTYWGFFKENIHLFLVLGIFGALTGYLNTFIEREVPYNAYAGKLGVNHTPLSVLHAAVSGQNPLATPFPPADLIFGITCSILMFVFIALAILWAAINYRDSDRSHSSELHLISRVSFVTLFGSLMLVFLSYLIRNYGLLFQALLEIFAAFVALYVISFVIKRMKYPLLWIMCFIVPGAIDYLINVYVPFVSVFIFALGAASLLLAIVMVPAYLAKWALSYLKEKHLS
jgi:hypothetical protein